MNQCAAHPISPPRVVPSLYFPALFQARLQRGNILLKQGSTQEAREDFEAVVRVKVLNLSLLTISSYFGSLTEQCIWLFFFFSCSAHQITKKLRSS